MRIAVMLRTLDISQGISVYATNLMRALLRVDQENDYYFMYSGPKWLGTFGAQPNLHEVVVPTRSRLLWDQYGVPRAASKIKADIIFSTKFSVPLFSLAKSMLVLHGSEWYVHPEFYSRLDILYNRLLFPVYCRKAAAISSVSKTSADDILRFLRLPPDKVHVIHSAIPDDFRRVTDTSALDRCKLKFRLPDNYILFVGKIYPGKNFGNIVRAFSRIKGRLGGDIKLVSVGDMRWDYQPELELVRELGLQDDIIFTGWVGHDELPGIYTLAKAFLFPSFYEGFGIPILEAMACGCPVVTASTGACPEIAGDAALLVDPNDPQEIAEQVVAAVRDRSLATELVARGHERVKDFSWDLAAQKTLNVFRRMLEQGN